MAPEYKEAPPGSGAPNKDKARQPLDISVPQAALTVNSENPDDLIDAVPEALRKLDQWVLWRLTTRHGRVTKVPFDRFGNRAAVNDPSTWCDFDSALQALREGQASGIGFVIAEHDSVVGIDLDRCVDKESGEVAPWAVEITERLDTYTEISPSGTGLHLLMVGQIPRNVKQSKPRGIEVYDESRFLTVTGLCVRNPGVLNEPGETLATWYGETFPLPESLVGQGPVRRSPEMEDDEVLELALNAKNGDRVRRLWEGDTSGHDHDPSTADAALLSHLAFYTQDPEQLDRLFRRSNLTREKWEERADYQDRTLAFVFSKLMTTFGGRDLEKELTDLGNAHRMLKRHGHELRFNVNSGRWLLWDGKRWAVDELDRIRAMAQNIATDLHLELRDTNPDSSYHKQLVKHHKDSQRVSNCRAMVEHLKALPDISVRAADLDADPWLLNFQNGTMDLRSGSLRDHDPADLNTKITAVAYRPGARSELWERYLREAFPDNPELVPFLQRLAGYTLTGLTSEEILVLLLGGAGSGKTTFLESLGQALGDYGTAARIESFLSDKNRSGSSASPEIARLDGPRFVRTVEPDSGKRFDASRLKQMTGGDTLVARDLYKGEFSFLPQFTLWVAANKSPEADADDEGLWRRLLRVPFEVARPSLEGKNRDKSIKETLTDPARSGEAVLAWAVEGCLAWQQGGLRIPEIVVTKTRALRDEMDLTEAFLAECCVFGDSAVWTQTSELYEAYETWFAGTGGHKPVNRGGFAKKLGDKGAHADKLKEKGRTLRVWWGVELVGQRLLSMPTPFPGRKEAGGR